ncbi:FixH family protein [Edaphocola aurantiacus]|uniref:FixH family protein n=1 Tax=Edaphocola aurantiacus TaxID=2601682 RepID=UPI001C97E882|nr:FixH family protein [Edaphocola aurantiacus]
MKKIFALVCVAIALCTYTSCTSKKNNPKPDIETPAKSQLGTANTTDHTITLYADTPLLFTGYNRLYVKVQDATGAVSSTANVSIHPLMEMSTMSHSAPYEQVSYDAATGLYSGAAVFIMPTADDDAWKMEVTVNGQKVAIPVTVGTFPTKVISISLGSDNTTYIVSLLRPAAWKVGMNDVEFTVHKITDMMNFPAVDNLSLEMTPEMPSMGHGSPNNISPVSTGNGHYKGKVNYTMTGDWRLHLKVSDASGTVLLQDAFIDILF